MWSVFFFFGRKNSSFSRLLRDRTSSGASGEDGIYLSLRGLYGHGSVINIVTGDDVVILVDFERVAIHINY